MSLLTIFLVIIVVGICLFAVNRFVPMEANVKKILNAVAIIILIVWLLKVFGIWAHLAQLHI